MNSERWAEIRSLVERAVALPAEERSAFLNSETSDAGLIAEVEEHLAYDRQASAMFSIENWQQRAARTAAEANLDGTILGNYRLLKELGRGGMGAVYIAERADGVYQQKVALKVLQENIFTPSLADRFRQERQILARLQHPGIARLLDGGVMPDGRPYLVLEYVDGEPIDRYCDAKHVDVEGRLRLFLKVAEVVQSAHQQLVLHLDLKPANILVTPEGEPRLLDFGIARILSEHEGGTLQAEATLRLLTPRYASPEQALGAPLGVASDVFSLATLLYRLLTGVLPYPIDDANPLEAARMIREVPPVLASQAAPPALRPQLRGDLDTILLQALRKEPERRYPTVAAFAADVQRHLASEPVLAHADSFNYRAGKFLRRNRAAVIAASIVVVILSGSAIAVVHSAIVARRERAVAERRLQDVRALAHTFIFDLDPKLQGIPGTVAVRGFVLDTGMKYLDAMAKEAGQDDDLAYEVANGYARLGRLQNDFVDQSQKNVQGQQASFAKAMALADEDYRHNPKDPVRQEHYLKISLTTTQPLEEKGDIAGYEAAYQKLWEIGQPLLDAAHDRPAGLLLMASVAGELATNRIGNGALWSLADPAGGLEWNDRASSIMARYLREYPGDPSVSAGQADMIYYLVTEVDGYIEEANEPAVLATTNKMLQITGSSEVLKNPAMSQAQAVVADYSLTLLILEHRLSEAKALVQVSKPNAMREQGDNSWLDVTSSTKMCGQGALQLELGNAKLGTEEMQRGLDGYEALMRANPSDINPTVEFVLWATRFGMEPLAPADLRAKRLRRVLQLSEAYAAAHPEVVGAQARIATARLLLAGIEREKKDFGGAATDLTAARAALKLLRLRVPNQPQAKTLDSQIDAVASGALDGDDACRQRIGALRFATFFSGKRQVQSCGSPASTTPGTPEAP